MVGPIFGFGTRSLQKRLSGGTTNVCETCLIGGAGGVTLRPLLAQSGHIDAACQCPLSELKGAIAIGPGNVRF